MEVPNDLGQHCPPVGLVPGCLTVVDALLLVLIVVVVGAFVFTNAMLTMLLTFVLRPSITVMEVFACVFVAIVAIANLIVIGIVRVGFIAALFEESS